MKKLKFITVIALSLMMLIGIVACAPASDKPVLKMVCSADFPPYEFVDADNNIVGIDAEIAQAIADDLGYELKIEDMMFKSIITAVQTGSADIAMSGITVRPDRLEQVNFTTPYTQSTQVVLVKADSTIAGVADLNGKKIGVQLGTTGDIYVDDIEGAQKEQYEKYSQAVLALNSGTVDAVVLDKDPANAFAAESDGGLKVLDEPLTVEDYAIAVNKEDTELLDAINASLAKLTEDGTIQGIIDKYIK